MPTTRIYPVAGRLRPIPGRPGEFYGYERRLGTAEGHADFVVPGGSKYAMQPEGVEVAALPTGEPASSDIRAALRVGDLSSSAPSSAAPTDTGSPGGEG